MTRKMKFDPKKPSDITRGTEITRHHKTQVTLNDIEYKQLQRMKEHYKMSTDADVLRALIKRGAMSLPVKEWKEA